MNYILYWFQDQKFNSNTSHQIYDKTFLSWYLASRNLIWSSQFLYHLHNIVLYFTLPVVHSLERIEADMRNMRNMRKICKIIINIPRNVSFPGLLTNVRKIFGSIALFMKSTTSLASWRDIVSSFPWGESVWKLNSYRNFENSLSDWSENRISKLYNSDKKLLLPFWQRR